MTNIVVRAVQPLGISVTTKIPSTPVTLKNTIQADSNRRLDTLLDVIADTPSTEAGSTLVYDPTTDKYVVKMLDIDGGTF